MVPIDQMVLPWLAYVRTWRVFVAYWMSDWKAHSAATCSVRELFLHVPSQVNFALNLVSYNLFSVFVISIVGFSQEFWNFAMCYMIMPSLMGGFLYYYYRFGSKLWTQLTMMNIKHYINNLFVMWSMALVPWTLNACVHFFIVSLVDWCAFFLPTESFSFPLSTTELYLERCVYLFYGLMALLLLTLPLWLKGYRTYTQAVNRPHLLMSPCECVLEIIYFASQSTSALQICVPMFALFTHKFGIRFYMLHIVFGVIELGFSNYTSMIKECIVHQMMHEIRPLFQMTHAEHHICKGTHPTTAGFGLWEFFFVGNATGFSVVICGCPYTMLQIAYGGANLVVHTMYPSDQLLMHHTLHHVITADFYSGGVPSGRDFLFSNHLAQFNEKLSEKSIFCHTAYAWTNDAIAFLMIVFTTLLSHYSLGWTIFSVWDEIVWSRAAASA